MLMIIKKDIKKLPKTNLWINEWYLKNRQTSINSDYVNALAILGSFYKSRYNSRYVCNKSTSNFPKKVSSSFMRLVFLLIITSKLQHFHSLIRFEIPHAPKVLLNSGVVMEICFQLITVWRYEAANFSQKNVLFSGHSHCKIHGTTQ